MTDDAYGATQTLFDRSTSGVTERGSISILIGFAAVGVIVAHTAREPRSQASTGSLTVRVELSAPVSRSSTGATISSRLERKTRVSVWLPESCCTTESTAWSR